MTVLPGYDSMGTQEPADCHPWVLDFDECCDTWDDYGPLTQRRAQSLAWSTLRTLTGGRVGSCPVTIRPCLRREVCNECFGVSWMQPYTDANGNWKNNACRREGQCSCCDMCEIMMPGRVAVLTRVRVDGYTIDKQLFRIDNGNRLVRQDGLCWPGCQNLGAPAGAIGTFDIEYIPGIVPTEAGLWAAATLSCEFAKACSGGKCRLPSTVTTIARQGVTMELSSNMFENGTGIREVDAYVFSVNPHNNRVPSRVMSPDVSEGSHRFQNSQLIATPPTGTG